MLLALPIGVKVCSKCGISKSHSEFYKEGQRRQGRFRSECKKCTNSINSKYIKSNLPVRREIVKRWLVKRPGYYKSYCEKNYVKHLAYNRVYFKKWRAKNKHKVDETRASGKARKLKATPRWRNQFFIDEIYHLAKLRTKVLGYKWHVDHIVPLKSALVCGLHCEHNLQVIPASRNISKGNRHWPDMP